MQRGAMMAEGCPLLSAAGGAGNDCFAFFALLIAAPPPEAAAPPAAKEEEEDLVSRAPLLRSLIDPDLSATKKKNETKSGATPNQKVTLIRHTVTRIDRAPFIYESNTFLCLTLCLTFCPLAVLHGDDGGTAAARPNRE